MLLPSDPLLPAIAEAQAADPDMFARIATLRGGSDEESNLVLPEGKPSGRLNDLFRMQAGILYH